MPGSFVLSGAVVKDDPLPQCQENLQIIIVESEPVQLFAEVQGFLLAGARELGFKAKRLAPGAALEPNGTGISPCDCEGTVCVMTAPCTRKSAIPISPIWVNLEVLNTTGVGDPWPRHCLEAGGGYSEAVWSSGPAFDYLHSNIQLLSQRGLANPLYLPLRYFDGIVSSPGTSKFPDSAAPVLDEGFVDVLFVGGTRGSSRRNSVLEALSARGLKMLVLTETFGLARELAVRRAKVVLNVHYYPMNFETVRLFWLLSLGAFVITEADESINAEVMREYNGSVVFSRYEGLVDTVVRYIPLQAERTRIAKAGFDFIRATSPGKVLRPLFDSAFPHCSVV